jgi:NAD(P)-dependent dehydrogenase (short-subunit alcohol dehydrogenase family)
MREFKGKTAVVTGGASGIGLAMAKAFAENGMNVMLADVEQNALDAALKDLNQYGNHVRGVVCDVADPDSVERAAQASFAAFGKVHILRNNAGVAAGSGIDSISVESWRWVVDVNLMGVVYGVRSFLPHIRAHGEGGHIVNTASMAGMVSGWFSPYDATKFAVVAMSEGLRPQLQPLGIGVSVLCPYFVRTKIGESGRNRQERYGQMSTLDPGSPVAAVVERSESRSRPDLILLRSPRASWPRSRTRNSTSLPIRTCGSSSRRVLPRSRRRWTGSSRHGPGDGKLIKKVPDRSRLRLFPVRKRG